MESKLGQMRSHTCGELNKKHLLEKVSLCGWVHKVRNLGGLLFIDLRDKYGLTQLAFDSMSEESKQKYAKISLESVLEVHGIVKERPSEAINKNNATGEVEVNVLNLKVLSTAAELPFLPREEVAVSEELKLKYRYLALREKRMQEIISLRSSLMKKTREVMYQHNFCEVETPILYKSTPEGARDYLVPSRIHKNKYYALPQSPQTLKQLLMVANTDRYFQICRCFRDEDLRADRQPEFTQLDIEASFINENFIENLAKNLVKNWFGIDDLKLSTITYEDAMSQYGSDKPDNRFKLIQHDITNLLKNSEFDPFQKAIAQNSLIKMMFLSSEEGSLSRKDLDQLNQRAQSLNTQFSWAKFDGDTLSGGVSKFLDTEFLNHLKEMQLVENSGILLFVSSEKSNEVHQSSDALRRYLRDHLGLVKDDSYSFLWVREFPLYEYNESEKRLSACHHPFTAPLDSDLDNFYSDNFSKLQKTKAEAYDLVCNGLELGGGSIRIHDAKMQAQMFKNLGFGQKDLDEKFGFFNEALSYGTPPHGGIAFGFDRLVSLVAKTQGIRDVIVFPKTTSATDLMADTPSFVSAEQLSHF